MKLVVYHYHLFLQTVGRDRTISYLVHYHGCCFLMQTNTVTSNYEYSVNPSGCVCVLALLGTFLKKINTNTFEVSEVFYFGFSK